VPGDEARALGDLSQHGIVRLDQLPDLVAAL
jgi:hypothetical protein